MEPVYVTGHRNPDTDSVVSAIAYASLRNALGDRHYVPAVLGEINDQTAAVLQRFDFPVPERLFTVKTQVRDLEYDVPPILSAAVSAGHAWSTFMAEDPISIPVTDEDGKLFGMLSRGDIAEYIMETLDGEGPRQIPLFNFLNMLDGTLLKDSGREEISFSRVMITVNNRENSGENFENAIVICGEQPEILEQAARQKAACIILIRSTAEAEALAQLADVCVISTPLDAYQASRAVYRSIPVSRICKTEGIVAFHLDDYLDAVKEQTLQTRYRSYPILDGEERVVGTLSRYHLLNPRRKKVVLVDHNETAQSVPGLFQADILEIIDHHRLGDVQTRSPITVRNEPVGSTATIIAGMYQEKGIVPSPKMAGLLASAILSDTVLFKSPTCTETDIRVAKRLERISGVSLKEIGEEMFAVGIDVNADAKTLLYSDFKEFHLGGHALGIGQITCLDSASILARADEFLACMQKESADKQYDMMLLMVSDVLKNGSELLVTGDTKIISQAYGAAVVNNRVFLPGVLSRKKQIVPALSLLWG